jgi:Holliday junction resolvase
MAESDVLRACMDYLDIKGAAYVRVNCGGFKTAQGGFMRCTDKNGVSDIIATYRGRTYYIECKSARGALSEAQKAFRGYVERAGGVYITARGVEDLQGAGL